jgi:adenine-specific DNA-methyltransferase
MAEQDFIKAGFTVVGTENNENKLLSFLKENYPNVIRDTEINLEELKTVLGLPIDEKVNGYGLNFVGRNFARAKYAQKTEKELRLNNTLSKNIDTTENLVLKGNNLDSLKILKNHYSGKINCIYIDPPYNTSSEQFVYPDKFDKEEAEVLGLANLSESDFARMDFSFKSKQSHNGWLAFMYPRLLLARDLLSNDGVVFISIDENEQANLKLLCDDVFGEENFVGQIANINNPKGRSDDKYLATAHEYLLVYARNKTNLKWFGFQPTEKITKRYNKVDNDGKLYREIDLRKTGDNDRRIDRENLFYYFYYNEKSKDLIPSREKLNLEGYREIVPMKDDDIEGNWRWGIETSKKDIAKLIARYMPNRKIWGVFEKDFLEGRETIKSTTVWDFKDVNSERGTEQFMELGFEKEVFPKPKPIGTINRTLQLATNDDCIILDFFAGSGTTGQAVMQLNADDGGNRKFILCQIDEPIKEDKPAYKFCIDNNLPPVISSITIERLKRAGAKITKDIEAENSKTGLFEEDKKQVPDIGYKVFDSVEAPKLNVDETGQISITENETDALSRIYNMIFTIGLDEPTQVPEEVIKDSIYKIGNHYYITNSEKITSDDYSNALKNGKVFIDGWTASLNGTLQNYKEDVKIVF